MTDKLTEALAWVHSGPTVVGAKYIIALADEVERWRDFPTDDDMRMMAKASGEARLESGYPAFKKVSERDRRAIIGAALEAVKREDNPATEKAVEVMRTNLDAVKREDQ